MKQKLIVSSSTQYYVHSDRIKENPNAIYRLFKRFKIYVMIYYGNLLNNRRRDYHYYHYLYR